jgi:plasmid maintenance system antidote protein VapI
MPQALKVRTPVRPKAQTQPNPRIGSDFEDFLRDEGRLEIATSLAIKRVIAWEFGQAMQKANVTQTEMAKRMGTSRAVVRRLLDETDLAVTLATLSKAATALGRDMQFGLAR